MKKDPNEISLWTWQGYACTWVKKYVALCLYQEIQVPGIAAYSAESAFTTILSELESLVPLIDSESREDALTAARKLYKALHRLDLADKMENTSGRTEAEIALIRDRTERLRAT